MQASVSRLTWIAVALVGQGAVAAPALPANPPTLPTVVVEASRLRFEEQVRTFVGAVTRRVNGESPALWHKRVCPLVAGLTRVQGEFVLQRISEMAAIAGAPLGAEDCRANLFVIFATEPAAFLRAWRKRNARLFGGAAPPRIERFIESGQPARAWYNTRSIGADGAALASLADIRLPSLGGNDQAEVGRLPNSRIEHGTVLSLDSVIVVVDAAQVQGRKLGPMGDYIAMIGLAELQADGDYAAVPTILNLFRTPLHGYAPDAMSDWDKSLLTSMYASEQKYTMYRAQVTQRMLTEVSQHAPPGGQ